MGLGIEIYFFFDKDEPIEKAIALKQRYGFDIRNGLALVMSGLDSHEALEENQRLLTLIEKELNIDLSLLDFWNNDEESGINAYSLKNTLIELKSRIEANPEFYKKINYGFNIEENYLKSRFLRDTDYMLEKLQMNIENGATIVRYSSD